MNYIINPMWFYWLHVVEGVRGFIEALLVIFGVGFIIMCALWGLSSDEGDDEGALKYKKYAKWLFIVCAFVGVVLIAIPSKKVLIEMQIARYATYENANWTLETIKSAVDYIVESIGRIK